MAEVRPRDDYLNENDRFMALAVLEAQRSRDPSTQVGACIVKDDKVVGLGHNQMYDNSDIFPWTREKDTNNKYLYVLHAELNAIMNKDSADVKGGTVYVTLFPCNECAKLIIKAGLKDVVYLCDKYHNTDASLASRLLLNTAGIEYRPFQRESGPTKFSLDLEYNE